MSVSHNEPIIRHPLSGNRIHNYTLNTSSQNAAEYYNSSSQLGNSLINNVVYHSHSLPDIYRDVKAGTGRLWAFQIQLENKKTVYSPGETVRGTLIIKSSKLLIIPLLRIVFQGRIITKYHQGEVSFGNTSASVLPIFKTGIILVRRGVLSRGIHEFKFEFYFPNEKLPASYSGSYGSVEYEILSDLYYTSEQKVTSRKELTLPSSAYPNDFPDNRLGIVAYFDYNKVPHNALKISDDLKSSASDPVLSSSVINSGEDHCYLHDEDRGLTTTSDNEYSDEDRNSQHVVPNVEYSASVNDNRVPQWVRKLASSNDTPLINNIPKHNINPITQISPFHMYGNNDKDIYISQLKSQSSLEELLNSKAKYLSGSISLEKRAYTTEQLVPITLKIDSALANATVVSVSLKQESRVSSFGIVRKTMDDVLKFKVNIFIKKSTEGKPQIFKLLVPIPSTSDNGGVNDTPNTRTDDIHLDTQELSSSSPDLSITRDNSSPPLYQNNRERTSATQSFQTPNRESLSNASPNITSIVNESTPIRTRSMTAVNEMASQNNGLNNISSGSPVIDSHKSFFGLKNHTFSFLSHRDSNLNTQSSSFNANNQTSDTGIETTNVPLVFSETNNLSSGFNEHQGASFDVGTENEDDDDDDEDIRGDIYQARQSSNSTTLQNESYKLKETSLDGIKGYAGRTKLSPTILTPVLEVRHYIQLKIVKHRTFSNVTLKVRVPIFIAGFPGSNTISNASGLGIGLSGSSNLNNAHNTATNTSYATSGSPVNLVPMFNHFGIDSVSTSPNASSNNAMYLSGQSMGSQGQSDLIGVSAHDNTNINQSGDTRFETQTSSIRDYYQHQIQHHRTSHSATDGMRYAHIVSSTPSNRLSNSSNASPSSSEAYSEPLPLYEPRL